MTTDTISEHEVLARGRFDDWSESATFQRLRPWLAYVQDRLMARIDWVNSRRILDIGCGSGWAVYQAAERICGSGGEAHGCDISEGMLHQRAAEHRTPSNAYFIACSAQSLPYANGSFDAAICTAAFHHFPDPLGALREVQRVLRPGGLMMIADTCRDQSVGTWIWDRLHRWFEEGHVKYYRTDELVDLLETAGFGNVDATELNPSYAESKKLIRKSTIFSAVTRH